MSCEYCHTLPHLQGCPNVLETEPKGVYECSYCGETIKDGDWFYRIGSEFYHSECLKEGLTATDVLEAIGIEEEMA